MAVTVGPATDIGVIHAPLSSDLSEGVVSVRDNWNERSAPMAPNETPDTGSVIIDCDDCAVRGHGCQDCVISVLLGVPETLRPDEARALEVLADVGLAPRLRLVPIHRDGQAGVA
jgi:hypothetical protein